MNEISEHTIDIDRILSSKMGSKARFVPSLLTNWLKRIIHQDQVNAFIWKTRDMQGVEWLEECVRYLKMDIEIVGKENLPPKDDGRLYTFVSNHPLGGQDGVALGSIIGRHYDGRFRYLVNDLLMNLPGLAPVCIGINKTGRNGRDFPRMVEAGFKSEREKKDMARLFQALRIEVNHEMDALREMLAAATELLAPGGRLSVITYHSLEDRIVKNVMKAGNPEGKVEQDFFGRTNTPYRMVEKLIIPSDEEQQSNPRSRSAKLRIAERKGE